MKKTVPQLAREALEVLDQDGWCKGSTSLSLHQVLLGNNTYLPGSHCLGGAWNKACYGSPAFRGFAFAGIYEPLLEVILEQHPEVARINDANPGWDSASLVTFFNDYSTTTETDVRSILEKLAAKEG